MPEDEDREPTFDDRNRRYPTARSGPSWWAVALISAIVSGLVAVGLNVVLVPAGVGWRNLEHEGSVTVHGVG